MIDSRATFCICDFETTGVNTDKDLPIEIGCIFTDSNFVALGALDSLILWPVHDPLGVIKWTRTELPAFNVHGITVTEMQQLGKSPENIAGRVTGLVNRHSNPNRRMTLISDNIQFEWNFMQKIFKEAGATWPFHYCGWDSSLLLDMVGVGDPKPKHRALADAGLLQQALIRALDRCRNLES